MENQKPKAPERKDITIDGSTAKYTTSYQSLNSGTLIGSFTFRCYLDPQRILAQGREIRELLGPLGDYAPKEHYFMALSVSELRQRIITAPHWFDLDGKNTNAPELELLYQVFGAAMDAETIYVESKMKEKERLIKQALDDSERLLKQQKEDAKVKKAKDPDELDLDEDES